MIHPSRYAQRDFVVDHANGMVDLKASQHGFFQRRTTLGDTSICLDPHRSLGLAG
jgi:hypothetical protein